MRNWPFELGEISWIRGDRQRSAPLPLHLLGLSGRVGREEEFARVGRRSRDVEEPFPNALGVGGGGPSTWFGSGRHSNPDRSGRHVLGPAPRPAMLLPPPASLETLRP